MDDELRLRSRMIGAGIWLSVVLLCAVGGWIVATWSRPHRSELVMMLAAGVLVTAVIASLPRERIVESRWREPFCLAWSLSLITFIAAAAAVDAGIRSPVVLMLFVTLVYAALSYPRRSVVVVSVASLLAVLVVSQLHSDGRSTFPDSFFLAGLMVTLAATGGLCILQAQMQERSKAELKRISRTDPLTGALNRLGFTERMGAELRRGAEDRAPVALILLDFDGFKLVNDRLGHAAGDELLRWSTGAMAGALRPGDALARLGGDEFCAVLPGTGMQEAGEIAERLRTALARRIAACAGTAASDCDGEGIEELHRCADRRLYAAKRRRPTPAALRAAAG